MKKNYFFFVFLLTLSFFANSCTDDWFGISGSGQIRSEERSVSGFKNIELQITANVEIVYDSVFLVEIRDYDNFLSHISTEVIGDNLIIHYTPKNLKIRNSSAKITIYMPSLNSIAISGDGNISVMSGFNQLQSITISGSGEVSALEPFNTSSLTIKISGCGKSSAAGSTNQLDINISGSGNIDCYGLEAQQATCKISGSGDAYLNVVKILDVTISGSGNVTYIGDPVVSAKISGSGKIKGR
jgi:hypothetical protein